MKIKLPYVFVCAVMLVANAPAHAADAKVANLPTERKSACEIDLMSADCYKEKYSLIKTV